MSVLIKGMEMPKSCGNCFYDTRCDNWRLRNWGAPPPDDCPLVPVPPHGRLIDGDVAEAICFTDEDADCGKDFIDGILYAADFISKQPTILEAEGE